MSELSLNSTSSTGLDGKNKPVYREIALKEIMQYYTPRWMAVAGFVASCFAALNLPLFGYILSRYVFVLALPISTDEERAYF